MTTESVPNMNVNSGSTTEVTSDATVENETMTDEFWKELASVLDLLPPAPAARPAQRRQRTNIKSTTVDNLRSHLTKRKRADATRSKVKRSIQGKMSGPSKRRRATTKTTSQESGRSMGPTHHQQTTRCKHPRR